jgi:uncharacterized protein (TIGR02271 family)
MMAPHRTTVVGVFEDRQKADQAVDALRRGGFREDQIGVAMRHDDSMSGTASDASETESQAGAGAAAGALTGLGLGALAGLGVLSGMIPVVGPAIAGGTLGVLLTNAAAGAGLGGLAGALIGGGMPEHEASYYQGEFEAGRTIVTVTADGRADEANAILHRFGAYDMSTKTKPAMGTGASTTAATSSAAQSRPATARGTSHETAGRDTGTMQLKEEQLRAEKHPVETGEVHVRKEVRTEHKSIEVPVQREEVVVERTPVHGHHAAEGGIGKEGEIRVPVHEERVEVSKTPVVTEEVKVGKRTIQDTERVSGEVRKEEARVEHKGDAKVCDTGEDPRGRK